MPILDSDIFNSTADSNDPGDLENPDEGVNPTGDDPPSSGGGIIVPPRSDTDPGQTVVIDTTTVDDSIYINIPVVIKVVSTTYIPVARKIYDSLVDYLSPLFDQYYDQRRIAKTYINYRDDELYPLVNWKPLPNDEVALKLRDPLPQDKTVEDRVHISRELQNTYYDVIKFLPLDIELIPQLRPATVNISNIAPNRRITATLAELIPEIAGGKLSISTVASLDEGQFVHTFENYDVGPISSSTMTENGWRTLYTSATPETNYYSGSMFIVEDDGAIGGKAFAISGSTGGLWLELAESAQQFSQETDVIMKIKFGWTPTTFDTLGFAALTRTLNGYLTGSEYGNYTAISDGDFQIIRRNNGSETVGSFGTGSIGFTPSANTWYWLRVQNERAGPLDTSAVTRRIKVWAESASEPSTWQFEATEPGPGSVDGSFYDWDYPGTGVALVSGGVGFALNMNNNPAGAVSYLGYFGASNDLTNTLSAGFTGQGAISQSNYSNFVTNQILEKYYDINNLSAQPINVDYSDFQNFVIFGSAQKRLDVFKAKLEYIEELIERAPIFVDQLAISASGDMAGTYDTVFGTLTIGVDGSATLNPNNSATYTAIQNSFTSEDYVNTSIVLSKQIQELIRTFDDYEKTLWFGSNLPYSGSDDSNYEINVQYKEDFSYPKILGIPLATSTTSGSTWYSEMGVIAQDYDERNSNTLSKNVPFYLQDDEESIDFLTFVDMVGHHFDNVRIYIQNMENLYSRHPDIDVELSGELSARVLESFGVNIPSATSVESLIQYVTGPESGSFAYQDVANEYYKRYMHALPFLLKTKGTGQSIRSLLNVFGISENLISVRESLSNRFTTPEAVKVLSNEQDFALSLNSGSYLTVPFSASLRSPQTMQANIAMLEDRNQTLFSFGDNYFIEAVQHPLASTNTYYQNSGQIQLLSGSTTLLTSSYFDMFDENYFALQLNYNASGVQMYIRKEDNGDTEFNQSLVESAPSMSADWADIGYLYIGNAPSSGSYTYTSMSLDEFRLWGTVITQDTFNDFAENPGSYAGNYATSSVEDLYVRLSFNLPTDVSSSGLVPNTTPYENVTVPLDLSSISASGFFEGDSPLYQTIRFLRTVEAVSYRASSTTQTTDMIKIADPAPSSGTLSSVVPLVSIGNKFGSGSVGDSRLDISMSPVDAIDRDIIRAFGNINIGDYIGDPLYRNADRYEKLDNLYNVFVRDVVPIIDYNAFLKYFDKFLKLFNEIVEDYIPARARLTKGIVIRSPILKRNKINNRTNIKFSGETSRRTENAIETKDDVVRSYDFELPITRSVLSDIQSEFNSINSSLSLDSYGGNIDHLTNIIMAVGGGYNQSGFDNLNIELERPQREQEPQILYNPSSNNPTVIGGSVVIVTPPDNFTSNPTDLDVRTYFNNPYGVYYFDFKRYLPITESFMPSQPSVSTWVRGNSYSLGDVVIQPSDTTDSNGNLLSANGKYFVFKDQGYSAEQQVISPHPPQLDTQLWRPLRYIPQIYQDIKKVAYVNGDSGSLSILNSGSNAADSYPLGYTRRHFRFYREGSLGAKRRTYLGTQNTIQTTADGKQPFEVFDINVNTIQVGAPEQCD